MLISYKWLQELTDTGLRPNELRERLTMVGLAIDAVETHADDFVLDVEVPSNRPDCLSHVGVAREVAVIDRKELKLPDTLSRNGSGSMKTEGRSADLTSVEIKDPDLCPRYAARLVRGVPDDLLWRVELMDLRIRRRRIGMWITATAGVALWAALWVGSALTPSTLPQPPRPMVFVAGPPPTPPPPPPPPPPAPSVKVEISSIPPAPPPPIR